MATRLIPSILAWLVLSACSLQAPGSAPRAGGEEEWITLFNGDNLDGWTPKFTGEEIGHNYRDTFRAADGILSVNYDRYDTFDGKFGHLFYRQPFSHYILKLEYRMVGPQAPGAPDWAVRNNGVMLHSQAPETMAHDQPFPRSIEAQLVNGAATGDRPNGNVCTPGTHIEMNGQLITEHCTISESAANRGDGWVAVELEVRGDTVIRQSIDGHLAMEYSKPQIDAADDRIPTDGSVDRAPLTGGYIALQAESHPTEFRNIRLLDLSEE